MSTFGDSDSDSDLEIIGSGQPQQLTQFALPLSGRRQPPTFTYGSTQRKAAVAEVEGPETAASGKDTADGWDEDELAYEIPRSSGTVREPEDKDDSLELPKSSLAAHHSSTSMLSSPAHATPFSLPSARQPPAIKVDEVEAFDTQAQDPSDEPPPSSESDVFGAFFNDTQSFDPNRHGQSADIDIFARPPSLAMPPLRIEDDGDETRVEESNPFDRLRRDQEEARHAHSHGFDGLPSLVDPSLEDADDSLDADLYHAMEKQQLILQVERQRANANAEGQPRLMHLNRDGMFTQTEQSQFHQDTQSQFMSQLSDHEQPPEPAMPPLVFPTPAVSFDSDDDFSDSSHEGQAEPAQAPSPPPNPSQSRKRKMEHVSSSSPLTSLLSTGPEGADDDGTAPKRRFRARARVADSEDENEDAGPASSPSPKKRNRWRVIADDDEEEDVTSNTASTRRRPVIAPSESEDEGDDADVEDELGGKMDEDKEADSDAEAESGDEEEGASREGGQNDDDDDDFNINMLKHSIPYKDRSEEQFTDEEDEAEPKQKKASKPTMASKMKGKGKGTGKLVQAGLHSFLGLSPPPKATEPAPTEPADRRKAKMSSFIAGEAEESEDDEAMLGKKSKQGGLDGVFDHLDEDEDEEDEDAEDDGKDLEELVNDEQDEEQAAKDALVSEKYKADREAQDKADEELHTRATKGQLRKLKPGSGLDHELDDDAQDDIDRRRIAQGPQKRKVNGEKDGLDDIEHTAMGRVYKEDIRNDVADEADFLAPVGSDTDSESEVNYTDNENGGPLTAGEVRRQAQELARERKRAGRKSNAIVLSDGEEDVDGDQTLHGNLDDESMEAARRGVQFKNYVRVAKNSIAGQDVMPGMAVGQPAQRGRPSGGGSGRLMLREEDDDKDPMDLLLKDRPRAEAEAAKLRRAAEEMGEDRGDRRRFGGVGGGGGKQNTSSVTQFGQRRQSSHGVASHGNGPAGRTGAGAGAGAAVMKTGLGPPSARRPGSGGVGMAQRVTSKIGALFDGSRSLKFKESQ
ncbi:hypothetical protein V8E36_008194 [Tilletia maclaganii]